MSSMSSRNSKVQAGARSRRSKGQAEARSFAQDSLLKLILFFQGFFARAATMSWPGLRMLASSAGLEGLGLEREGLPRGDPDPACGCSSC